MRNFLAKKAKGEIILFMDSDAVMKKNCVEEIVKVFKKTDADAVSALPITPPREKTNLLNYLLGIDYEGRIRKMQEGYVSVAATTLFAIKKNVLEEVGYFNERHVFGEDWYFTKTMTNRGYKIWHTNKAKLYHYTAETFWKYLKKQFRYAEYNVYHSLKFKVIKDEYPKFHLGFKNYKKKFHKLAFFSLFIIRGLVWILGAINGTIKFVILKKDFIYDN